MRILAIGLTLWICGFLSTAVARADDEGFQSLFNGRDLSGWKFVLNDVEAEPKKTWAVEDDVIVCKGFPTGYFHSDKTYSNYIFRYDWKYVEPERGRSTYNSGLLIHIQPPHKVWPKCLEVQGANVNHGFIYFLNCKRIDSKFDKQAQKKATKPIGSWNTTEVIAAADGEVTAKINGVEVSSGKSDLINGFIGFQSEGAEIHFRNLKIRSLKDGKNE